MAQRKVFNFATGESQMLDLTPEEEAAALAAETAFQAALAQAALDAKDVDKLQKAIRALALVTRDYTNALKAEVRGLALLLVSKGTITNGEANGLLTYDGSGAGDSKTIADLKADFSAKWDSLP